MIFIRCTTENNTHKLWENKYWKSGNTGQNLFVGYDYDYFVFDYFIDRIMYLIYFILLDIL